MTKRSLIGASLLIFTLFTSPVLAAETVPTLNANTPDSYIVKKGDTLWDISAIFLEDPWLWPAIWRANPVIDNPHLIYPGDEIRLFSDQGKPYLTHYSSHPAANATPINSEQSLIPMAAIKEFMTQPLLTDSDQFKHAAAVIGARDNRLIYAQGDAVYVDNSTGMELNQIYAIYRAGAALHDPLSGKFLGQQATQIGQAVVTHEGVPARVKLIKTSREIMPGDRLIALQANPNYDFSVQHADITWSAQIISLVDALSQVGNYQVVVANAGQAQGLKAGHIASLYKRGAIKHELQLPDERTGSAVIFKAFDQLSYLLILDTDRPIRTGDLVTSGWD